MHWPAPWGLGSVSHHSMGCISCGILLSGTGARGVSSEHMENVEMFSENCALVWLSENRALACLFKGSQKQSFFLQTLLFTAFLVTVLKILTYTLVSTLRRDKKNTCEHMILGQLKMGAC